MAVNVTASATLASAQIGWIGAYVHTAILVAADNSKHESKAVQQPAVSFAAHDTLVSVFMAQYPIFDAAMIEVLDAIDACDDDLELGREIGEKAATKVIIARADDGHTRASQNILSALQCDSV